MCVCSSLLTLTTVATDGGIPGTPLFCVVVSSLKLTLYDSGVLVLDVPGITLLLPYHLNPCLLLVLILVLCCAWLYTRYSSGYIPGTAVPGYVRRGGYKLLKAVNACRCKKCVKRTLRPQKRLRTPTLTHLDSIKARYFRIFLTAIPGT